MFSKIFDKEKVIQFVKFGFVGASNTVISLAIYYLLIYFGVNYLFANATGYILSSLWGYILNKVWVFGKTNVSAKKSLVKYYIVYLSSFFLNICLMYVWVSVFGVSDKIAPLITLCFTVPYNFLFNKLWVFNEKRGGFKINIKNRNLLNFFSSFCILFIIAILLCDRNPLYDANYYWNEGVGLWTGGFSFNFLNFPETFRGYVYPFLVMVCRVIGKSLFGWEWLGFLLGNSLMIAATITLSLPRILHVDMSGKREIIGSCAFSILVSVFWIDHLIYSLSDIPAMAMMFGAFALIIVLREKSEQKKSKGIVYMLVLSFLLGVLLYCSYNTRAVYQYPCIIGGIIYLYTVARNILKKQWIYILSAIFVFAGVFIASEPQCEINMKYTGQNTPRVLTEQLFNYNADLQMYQLVEGMTYNRYETYRGDLNIYNSPGVAYKNDTGKEIIEKENIVLGDFATTDLLKTYVKYPLQFISIYGLHFISYISKTRCTTFAYDLFNDKTGCFLANAALWITAIWGIYFTKLKKSLDFIKKDSGIFLISLLPCALIIPGAPEVRFFMILYFYIYAYLCYCMDYKNFYIGICSKKNLFVTVTLVVLIFWSLAMGKILKSNVLTEFSLLSIPKPLVEIVVINAIGYVGCILLCYFILCYSYKTLKPKNKALYKKAVCFFGMLTTMFFIYRFQPAFEKIAENIETYLTKNYVAQEELMCFKDKTIPNTYNQIYVEQFDVDLLENELYKLSFEMDLKEKDIPELLYFDFFGENYDRINQDFVFEYSKRTKKYSLVMSSDNPPKKVCFRIIAKTSEDYVLKNVSLQRVVQSK